MAEHDGGPGSYRHFVFSFGFDRFDQGASVGAQTEATAKIGVPSLGDKDFL
jgi:hypothetical protein